LVPIANTTVSVALVTRFPYWSCTSTVTAGLIVAPATTALGCTTNASFVAVPAVTPIESLAPVRLVALALTV
jgi:hypothetical protein